MNVTIPDELYERLDKVRDRLNASRVCARALERELDGLGTSRVRTDTRYEALVQRLLSARGSWYLRGHTDGEDWRCERATREQLRSAAAEDIGSETFAQSLPEWFDEDTRIEAWALEDSGGQYDDGTYADYVLYDRCLKNADRTAYRRGWRTAVREIWEAVAPLVQPIQQAEQ